MLHMFFVILITAVASAGNWTKELTWDVKSPGPQMAPFDWDGPHLALVLDRCIPGASADANGEAILNDPGDPSCFSAEADVSWPSSNSNFFCESTSFKDDASVDWVVFKLVFNPPTASNGVEIEWPTSWPSYVDCTKTYGPYTHKWRVHLDDDDEALTAVQTPSIATVTAWGSTVALTMDSAFTGKAMIKWVRVAQDAYTGAAVANSDGSDYMGDGLTTTGSGGVTYVGGTACAVFDQPAGFDWLMVAVQYGTTAGSGYCRITKDGTPTWMKFTWAY